MVLIGHIFQFSNKVIRRDILFCYRVKNFPIFQYLKRYLMRYSFSLPHDFCPCPGQRQVCHPDPVGGSACCWCTGDGTTTARNPSPCPLLHENISQWFSFILYHFSVFLYRCTIFFMTSIHWSIHQVIIFWSADFCTFIWWLCFLRRHHRRQWRVPIGLHG